jgi:hypothetical protein
MIVARQGADVVNRWSWRIVPSLLLGLAAGCASKESAPAADVAGTCQRDVDCPGAFCDRGRCAPEGKGNFGAACVLFGPGRPDPREYKCGAYVCLDDRCRSCTSDDECQQLLGSPTCAAVEGWPGKRCGSYPAAAASR